MLGWKCFQWSRIPDSLHSRHRTFSLPSPLPKWPPGQGFANGRINIGELEVVKITQFEYIWDCDYKNSTVAFYKPVAIPDGFRNLGFYCESSDCSSSRGFVLVAKEVVSSSDNIRYCPALLKPLDYKLIWCSNDGHGETFNGSGCFWFPNPPEGYEAMGFVVTTTLNKPELDEIWCVRSDLTDRCETYRLLLDTISSFSDSLFRVWEIRPSNRGMLGRGVHLGTFFCSNFGGSIGEHVNIACLKNLNPSLQCMPNLDQIHAMVSHYGPTFIFHPDEIYLPSSVSWFFMNGALLYKRGELVGEPIEVAGSNLPANGTNDGAYWIDLPIDDRREHVKRGNVESSIVYVHVKPALGGTFTDIVFWIFCPFNGPGTLKLCNINIPLGKIGQHVCDWEHVTLRISNFTGELWNMYLSQHSGGKWVDASNLEFIEGNKAIVYSSRNGHASFHHPGSYIQGSKKLGVGIRNDAAYSNFRVDSSVRYEIISAGYLGNGVGFVKEPCWLLFMRKWGPKVSYSIRNKLDQIVNRLPVGIGCRLKNVAYKLPVELYGEDGPTGPKEKNNWVGDERS
ncbi:uncharacterized protein LOC124926667 [Impatiens glandulifera]|uniref:uncharacterized protein LOC124926667 n=1 Tax=Impatiens glandulifera TaxID=253017 RepID=UPI001FB18CB7|nr:uncharacterized protein LOC124926667 [Impatiens glandulifera]